MEGRYQGSQGPRCHFRRQGEGERYCRRQQRFRSTLQEEPRIQALNSFVVVV